MTPKPEVRVHALFCTSTHRAGGTASQKTIGVGRFCLVLPHRIELWTSPLPRGCSTTELRQHALRILNRPQRRLRAGGSCHKASRGASTREPGEVLETARKPRVLVTPI